MKISVSKCMHTQYEKQFQIIGVPTCRGSCLSPTVAILYCVLW